MNDHPTLQSLSQPIKTLLCSLALVALALGTVRANETEYTITVNVSADGFSPGSFADNQWSFPSGVPATFVGTFEADNSAVGAISDLSLVIGGLNLASSNPAVAENSFNPFTDQLTWEGYDVNYANSLVTLGVINPIYAVAIQNSNMNPLDPYYGDTQNWVGTFSVAPGSPSSVPDGGATVVMLGSVLAGLGVLRRRISRA